MNEKNPLQKKAGQARKMSSFSKSKPVSIRSKSKDSPVGNILHLQRTVGNREVQRLIKSGKIQARLTIGKPNDRYEQEADRVADKVMKMPEPKQSLVNGHSSLVQRQAVEEEEPIQTKPLADQITPFVQRQAEPEEEEEVQTKLQRQAEEEEEPIQGKILQRQETEEEEEKVQTKLQRQEGEEEEEEVQTKLQRQAEEEEEEPIQTKQAPNQAAKVNSNIESSVNSLKGGGQPLSESTRSYFEPRFGTDFSQVRVHTDSKAAAAAKSINSKAFTTGQDVVFGAGHYSPGTSTGKNLLAHELTHVVQQRSHTSYDPSLQRGDDPGEPVAPTGAREAPAGVPRPDVGRPSPDNRDRHQITVVDYGENADIANWRDCVARIGEIEAQNVNQMIDEVIEDVGDVQTDCISRLTLVGHGSPGSISVGDGSGWVEGGHISSRNFRNNTARLIPFFCDGATVVLNGCNVGRGATGARFIQALSDFWQVNVAAPTGRGDGFGIMGVWVWGLPGQVLPNDTALIVDQIVRILDETTYGDDEEMIFDLLEAGRDRGLLQDIQAQLVQQGRWDTLQEDLIGEDEDRFNQLFPPP